MTILWEDAHMLVACKPPGLPTQGGDSMASRLICWRKASGQPEEIYPVHRLDQGVGGCMVWAKDRAAAAVLSQAIATRTLQKEYLAVVRGCPTPPEARMTDLLFHDKTKNKTYVVQRMRKGVREAALTYRVLQRISTASGDLSLVQILLHTGRTHQIRAQFAARGTPLVGDRKYGGGSGSPALWSWRLTIPAQPAPICITSPPPQTPPWSLFSERPQQRRPQ